MLLDLLLDALVDVVMAILTIDCVPRLRGPVSREVR
jgi:hypothetical protein